MPLKVSLVAIVFAASVGSAASYRIEQIASHLNQPSSFAVLPDGEEILITEKGGQLRRLVDGRLADGGAGDLPPMFVGLQAGLLDIELHPRFKKNRLVYLSMTRGTAEANSVRVVRGRYEAGRLEGAEEIFQSAPARSNAICSGARMAFLPDESLLISIGDGYDFREQAQSLTSMLGKIVRVKDDGTLPEDNPYVGSPDALPQLWSVGHRCVLGILYDSSSGWVIAHENGPWGGDELNHIARGQNYGWPIATYGLDYSGAYVSPFSKYPATVEPITYWTPSIAPSGLGVCRKCQWFDWDGDLFAGALAGRHVRRLRLRAGKLVEQEALFSELGERIRDLSFGKAGELYLLTDGAEGKLLKVTAARQDPD